MIGKLIFFLSFISTISYSQSVENFDHLFEEYEDQPGAVVDVFKAGEIIFQKGYGLSNLDYGIELSPESVLDIASIGKQFTAAAVILLEIAGKLELDDSIRNFLPEMPEYPGDPITIKHLIYHTSGIRDYIDIINFSGESWDKGFTEEEILNIIIQQPRLNIMPGERFEYCNSGYVLLGQIVKRITGQSLGEFIKEQIFGPLDMKSSLLYENSKQVIENRAIGYSRNRDAFEVDNLFYFTITGDGQLMTNVRDFKKWDDNYSNNKIGDSTFLYKMFRKGVLNNGDTLDYASGIFRKEYHGFETIEHSGSSAGFRSYYVKIPEKNLAVVVFSNFAGFDAIKKGNEILDILLNTSGKTGNHNNKDSAKKPDFFIAKESLNKYAGMYWNDRFLFDQNFYILNDTLRVNSDENKLIPLSEGRFVEGSNTNKVFQFSRNGNQLFLQDGSWELELETFKSDDARSELQKYLGEYQSEALKSTITIKQESDKISLYKNGKRFGAISLKGENEYYVNFFGIFQFDDQGNLKLSTGRLKNVIFTKLDN